MADLPLMPFPTKSNMRPSSYSFTPTFFHLTTTANDTPGPSRPTTRQQHQPVIYSPEKYRSVGQFIRSRDFRTFKKEYEDVLDRIAAFVNDHGNRLAPPLLHVTKKKVKDDFNALKGNLFDLQKDYFGIRTPEMYGMGKELFHAFEDLLKNEKIPLAQRMDAVIELAGKARVCAGGVLSDLQATIAKLKASHGGLKGSVYEFKLKKLEDLSLQYVKANNPSCTQTVETHYCNAYYNYVAPDMGLEARPDKFVANLLNDGKVSLAQLNAFREFVFEKLNPMLLANEMADQYRTRLEKSFHDNGIAPDNIPFEKIQMLQDIQEGELAPAYGEVSPHTFLEPIDPTDYDSAYAYTGSRWPTGVVRHFLKEFKKQGWADDDKKSKIVLGDTGEGRIKTQEGLLWLKVKGEAPKEPTAQDWLKIAPKALLDNLEKAAPTDAQARTSLLRAFIGAIRELPQDPGAALETWLRDFAAEMKARPSWPQDWATPLILLAAAFNKASTLDELLLNMTPVQMQKLLNAKDSQGNYLLSTAMQDGQADAAKVVRERLNHCLYTAMRNGRTDVIGGMLDPLRRLPPEAQMQILLNAKAGQGTHLLYTAMEKGHADVAEVLLPLLRRLPPTVQTQLLLNAEGSRGMCMAMQNGHDKVLDVLSRLFSNLSPQAQMQILLNAKDSQGNYGLCMAMERGHIGVMTVLGELLLRLPPAQCAELLAITDGIPRFANLFKKTFEQKNWKALKQYVEIVRKITPTLGRKERAALLSAIQPSHVKKIWNWLKGGNSAILKKKDPNLYWQFKEMKKALSKK